MAEKNDPIPVPGDPAEPAPEPTAIEPAEPVVPDPGQQTVEVFNAPLTELPAEWAGKSAAEIRTLWETAGTVMASTNDANEAYKQRIADLEAARPAPIVEPVEDPDADVDMKQLIYENPEKAFDIAMRRKYGPLIDRIEENIGDTAIINARSALPDFERYEDTVKQLVKGAGAGVNDSLVRQAYLTAVGMEKLEADTAERSAAAARPKPEPDPPAPKVVPVTGLAAEIMRGSGFESEEEFNEYLAMDDEIEVEVPLGDPR